MMIGPAPRGDRPRFGNRQTYCEFAMGGLVIQSEEAVGSTFTVLLPMNIA